VDVPVSEQGGTAAEAVRVTGVDLAPGAREKTSLHFTVKAYSQNDLDTVSDFAESQYETIMRVTGLYSFMPSTPYQIVIFASHEEYIEKTKQPEWSGGITVGNAILTYNSESMKSVLAHEMTHLVFNEYLGRSDMNLVWLNEGLAVHIQIGTYPEENQKMYAQAVAKELAANPLPFDKMLSFVPLRDGGDTVDKWYKQVGSVVSFMLEKGGHVGFSMLLRELKNGSDINSALASAYPGKWDNTAKLEQAWKQTLQ